MSSKWKAGLQTARGTMDFDEFTDVVSELLKKAWGDQAVTFTFDEPTSTDPESVTLPVITYDVFDRIPSKSHKSLAPILFDRVKDEHDPSITIEIYRKWFDTQVDFKVFHKTNREARVLMENLENFLFEYMDYFKDLGISDIIFVKEMPPVTVNLSKVDIPCRTLRYMLRLERITQVRKRSVQKVDTVVNKQSLGKSSDVLTNYYQNLNRDHTR